jgi:hypothetical protein
VVKKRRKGREEEETRRGLIGREKKSEGEEKGKIGTKGGRNNRKRRIRGK